MTRQTWLGLALGLGLAASGAGCRPSAPLTGLFPSTVAGVWRRSALQDLAPSDAPDPVPRTSINRLQSASYEGPGKLEARVYELDTPAVAPELAQRWRPSADTVFFYRDQYFVVIKWQDADRKALEAFVRELETRLGKPKEPA
ncbi:MAG: hypothetical protein LAP40_07905 [Acidobacteriia bacterium]|nr:hypothetical protein [Terriglobia bacterium]